MSQDIDWKETDRLMDELRRQLALDENATENGEVTRPETGEGSDADAAMAESAAPVATAVALADAEPTAVTEEAVRDEISDTAAATTESVQTVEKPKKKRRPRYQNARATFSTRPDAMDEFADTVPVSHKRPDAVTIAPPPTADEVMRAEDTVESLMRDLFGGGSARAASAASDAPAATEDTEADEQAEAAVAEDTPITMTRAADGQMALALPEIGADAEGEETFDAVSIARDEMHLDLFSAFTVGKERRDREEQREPEEAPAAESELKQSVESSEEDFRFLLDLDYEDELGRAIGFEKIRDYHETDVNGQEPTVKRRRKRGEKREYEIARQGMPLRKQYAKQKRGHVIHLVLSAVIMCLLFLYERPQLMASLFEGSPIDGKLYPISYILIGIQLLVLAAFFSYRRLFEGFLRLIRFSPIDSSLCSVIFIVTFVYHLVQVFLPHAGYPVLFLSPAAASLMLLALADLLDWYRQSLAFQVVSSGKQKYALIPRVSVGGRQNDARARLLDGEQGDAVWYVHPVGFVRNYFANTAKRAEHQRSLGWQLLLIAAVGAVLGLYIFATGGTGEELWQTAFVTFLLCIPVTSLLVTSLPMFFASCLRLKKKSAIIGEEQVYQCGEPTTLVLPDSEIFSAMHNERFELVDDCDPYRVSVLVKGLLQKVQSPLADSIDIEDVATDITITEIEEHGIAAVAGEEKTSILFGSVEYLQKYGIRVQPRGTDLDDVCRRLLCVAIDRKVSALFLARYRLTADAARLLSELAKEDVRVMIRSKDPGVHNDLMARLLSHRGDAVRVMKPSTREVDIRTDRVDATVVSVSSALEAARAFVVCRRMRRVGNFGKALQGLSAIFGAAFAGVLTFFRLTASISPMLVTVYMLSWCLLHGAVSYFRLREKRKK